MTFEDTIRQRIISTVGSRKDSLLAGKHRMSPLMVRMLSNIHFAVTRAEVDGTDDKYLYAELGEYKPFSRQTVEALRKRGHIEIKASYIQGTVLHLVPAKGAEALCERAYNELGQPDKEMLEPKVAV